MTQTQTPVFIVSSGRAGSTLLAKMVHRHPQLLCVSDLFEPVGVEPYFDRQSQVTGEEFFRVLSRPSLPQRIRYWRQQPTGELLHLPADDNRVSLLLSYTLPFAVGGDPAQLYGELEAAAAGWPRQSMADHTSQFFDWLRDRFGKQLWVERTGGSLPHMRSIIETWPDAKIVHNFRDSRETAISMMTGSFFRLYLELEKNPGLGEWDMNYMPPVEEMGAMLNRWVVDAVDALEMVPAERQMNLSFESLLESTEQTLLGLVKFLFDRDEPTEEDIEWARKEVAVIRPPRLKFPALDADQQNRLTAAVSDSLRLLGYS